MSFSNRNKFQSQLHARLRMSMKRDLLYEIDMSPNPFSGTVFQDGGFLVGGSTVLTIARQQGYRFPLHPQKSGDLDLYLYASTNGNSSMIYSLYTSGAEVYERTIESRVVPLLRELIPKLGFECYKTNKLDLIKIEEPKFDSTVFFKKQYTKNEARLAINSADFEELWPKSDDYIDVYMEFDMLPKVPLTLIQPLRAHHFGGSSAKIFYDHPLNVLSQKMTRALRAVDNVRKPFQDSDSPSGFKVRDLIDIVNFTGYIETPVGREPFMSLQAGSEDIQTLRLLMIVNFARFGGKPEGIDFSPYFPTPEIRERFRESAQGKISEKLTLYAGRIDDILGAYVGIMDKVFPGFADNREIKLDPKEEEFIDLTFGKRKLPSGELAAARPCIKTQNLIDLYPESFSRHPELGRKINNHPSLNEKINRFNGIG